MHVFKKYWQNFRKSVKFDSTEFFKIYGIK